MGLAILGTPARAPCWHESERHPNFPEILVVPLQRWRIREIIPLQEIAGPKRVFEHQRRCVRRAFKAIRHCRRQTKSKEIFLAVRDASARTGVARMVGQQCPSQHLSLIHILYFMLRGESPRISRSTRHASSRSASRHDTTREERLRRTSRQSADGDGDRLSGRTIDAWPLASATRHTDHRAFACGSLPTTGTLDIVQSCLTRLSKIDSLGPCERPKLSRSLCRRKCSPEPRRSLGANTAR